MKRFLLSLLAIIMAAASYAQCDLNLSGLKLTVNPNQTSCKLNFDLSFYIDNNGGNKQIYINLWNGTTQYLAGSAEHNWTANNAKMPSLSQMDGASGGNAPVAVVGIDVVNNTFVPYYSNDNANINYTNKRLIKGTAITQTLVTTVGDPNYNKTLFVLSGLEMDIPGCANNISLKGNIWGSQVQIGNLGAQPSIQCYDNQFDFTVAGEVKINAASSFNCAANPRTFQLFLDATGNYTITYKVFVDLNGDGQVTTTGTPDPVAYTSGNINVSDLNPAPSTQPDYSSGVVAIPAPYGTDAAYEKKKLIVVVSYNNTIGLVDVKDVLNNSCALLPVSFKSFTAERKSSSSVSLKWTTSSEQNNKGFYVQRNNGSGWKDAAFVFSQANEGNSSIDLSYEFKDVYAEKGITQYRILQVDIDGKGKYSEIRAVRGEGAASKVVVYPNPSSNGNINVVFEDNSVRDILISDMQGKVVKQYREVTGNVLQVEGLVTGFYTMKVVNRNTATSVVEKVVVK